MFTLCYDKYANNGSGSGRIYELTVTSDKRWETAPDYTYQRIFLEVNGKLSDSVSCTESAYEAVSTSDTLIKNYFPQLYENHRKTCFWASLNFANKVGSGSVDGESAGFAICLCILSVSLCFEIKGDIAVTGKVDNISKECPIGYVDKIYEKIEAYVPNDSSFLAVKTFIVPNLRSILGKSPKDDHFSKVVRADINQLCGFEGRLKANRQNLIFCNTLFQGLNYVTDLDNFNNIYKNVISGKKKDFLCEVFPHDPSTGKLKCDALGYTESLQKDIEDKYHSAKAFHIDPTLVTGQTSTVAPVVTSKRRNGKIALFVVLAIILVFCGAILYSLFREPKPDESKVTNPPIAQDTSSVPREPSTEDGPIEVPKPTSTEHKLPLPTPPKVVLPKLTWQQKREILKNGFEFDLHRVVRTGVRSGFFEFSCAYRNSLENNLEKYALRIIGVNVTQEGASLVHYLLKGCETIMSFSDSSGYSKTKLQGGWCKLAGLEGLNPAQMGYIIAIFNEDFSAFMKIAEGDKSGDSYVFYKKSYSGFPLKISNEVEVGHLIVGPNN